MKYRRSWNTTLALIGLGFFSAAWTFYAQNPLDRPGDVSRWKTFTNRAGWTIKHPQSWQVGSCRQCADPTDPKVFVTLYNPATTELIMIERLIDKPPDQTIEQWLNDVKASTNLTPRVGEEWISLGGTRALKVINRSLDSTESENIYVVHDSKTFAIRADRGNPSYAVYQRMLSTFRFITVPPARRLSPAK